MEKGRQGGEPEVVEKEGKEKEEKEEEEEEGGGWTEVGRRMEDQGGAGGRTKADRRGPVGVCEQLGGAVGISACEGWMRLNYACEDVRG
jgi:hypothetical protein